MGGIIKSVGKIFGGGDIPAVAPAPATPTIKDDSVQRAAEEEARKRSNAGRASTIFAGDEDEQESKTSKILLGSA